MNTSVEQIARAVLYEGYLLYPYRHSSLKNQQRWNFGVLYPPPWSAQQNGPDRAYLHMECLVRGENNCRICVSLRFLHLTELDSAGRTWQEAEERQVSANEIAVTDLVENSRVQQFAFAGYRETKEFATVRQMPVQGRMEMNAARIRDRVFRLATRVTNTTEGPIDGRDDALLLSLASAHVLISITNGQLLSQTDPPEELREEAAACQNTGVWPVLVGEPGASDVLGSPIILYDYPQLAPESGGDLFDATEIDEILTLRTLTLTDEEKEEIRASDERGRRMLERVENAAPDHLRNLHGAIRGLRQTGDSVAAAGNLNQNRFRKGDRVRLRPRKRADLFDTLLAGKIAVVEAVEEDFDCQIHIAVVVEDDPGRDLGEMRQAGHRFFYGPDEVEPIVDNENAPAQGEV